MLEQEVTNKGLLLRGDASDLQHGELLLKGAIDLGESQDKSIYLKLLKLLFCFVFSFRFAVGWNIRQSSVCNLGNSRLMLFLKSCFICLWSTVESLQNLLFTRIGDQNPNDEKNPPEEQVRMADSAGEAEENHAASARTCKSHNMTRGGAQELNYWSIWLILANTNVNGL